MSGDRERLREMAAAYALDALDADDKREFELLLTASPELQREVDEYREVGGLLPLALPGRVPSPELWDRLRERTVGGAATTQVVPLVKPPPQFSRLAWAAAVAGLLVASGFWLRNRDMQQVVAAREAELERMTAELNSRDELIDNVLGSNTSVFTLVSTEQSEPNVRVYWNHDTNMWVLRAFNLEPTAPGRTYQFWFLQDGAPVPSVTFNPEQDGNATVSLVGPENTQGITGAAVSEEPAGGSQVPTTVVLIGQVE